jgi:EAL domain-containing protein (putative c-di-GMP-specific phosphodiesterase class I)
LRLRALGAPVARKREPVMDLAVHLAEASFERISAGLERDGNHWAVRVGGLLMRSRFQPIYSLSHGRVVGHEALLRAEDAAGDAVEPPVALRGDGSFADLLRGDRAARLIHALNFAAMAPPAHWLFFNMQPQVFVAAQSLAGDGYQRALQERCGLQGHQMVIEVLEEAVPDDADFDGGLRAARGDGLLIALDDFGAAHSNFDRVWRLQPEIVKLDRSLVLRAALEPQARSIVTHIVSLLHQCGALVLMEGIETQEEAFVALASLADLVQGDLFAPPAAELVAPDHAPPALRSLWDNYEQRRAEAQCRYHERIRPYINAIGYASALLAEGQTLEEAAATFLRLPQSEVCYLLGSDASQIGGSAWASQRHYADNPAFAPMRETEGARWARRPYYRRAMESVGKVQVTRPYRTLHGAHLCVTVSVAFRATGGLRVVCGDVVWDGETASPD